MPELLIGCGNRREKAVYLGDRKEWEDLTTLDIDPNCNPDIEWDLERLPLPFRDDYFDEIHAYHVLEHIGRQGDFKFFFDQFSDLWRILKPEGKLYGAIPVIGGLGDVSDPGHTRRISPHSFTFLSQEQYTEQVGKTAMTDYRRWYKADFEAEYTNSQDGDQLFFVLKAVKPSRISI